MTNVPVSHLRRLRAMMSANSETCCRSVSRFSSLFQRRMRSQICSWFSLISSEILEKGEVMCRKPRVLALAGRPISDDWGSMVRLLQKSTRDLRRSNEKDFLAGEGGQAQIPAH